MNVICGRGNARQRAYWSVEVESQPREWASTIERDGRALARPGVGNPGNREHCGTDVASSSRWARPTEVVSAVRHWMTINFHLIGFIWNSYFSFSLPLILSSISISITLPCWLPAFPPSHSLYPPPNYLSHFSMTAVVFYSSRVALAPNSFLLFPFLLFLTISRRFFVGVVENFHLLYVIFFCIVNSVILISFWFSHSQVSRRDCLFFF